MDMLSRLGIWDDALDDAPYSVGDTTSSDEVDELTSNLRRRLGLEPTPSPFHSFQGVDENRPPLPRPGHSNSDGLHHNMHRLRDLPYQVDMAPPKEACIAYKVVALIDGIAYSIYDGTTRYRPGSTWFQEARDDHISGLYVYRSYEQCLKRDASVFPSDSALLHAPRAIATVLCWNSPAWKSPKRYGMKEAYDCLMVKSIRPYPQSWYQSTLSGNTGIILQQQGEVPGSSSSSPSPGRDDDLRVPHASPNRTSLSSDALMADRSPLSSGSPCADRSAMGGRSRRGSLSPLHPSHPGRGESLLRRQVQNLELEDEITKMEQELERMRGFL